MSRADATPRSAARGSAGVAGHARSADASIGPWRGIWRQLPLLVALVVLWVLLWDHVDTLTVATGMALAVAVTRVFYLPPILLSGRFNVWRGLLLGIRMIADVVVASLQVARLSIDPRYHPVNSIVSVQLLTRSDLVTTLTAEAISVIPGTVVVDIDRERGLLYLHALGADTPELVAKVHRDALELEERIVLTMGTSAQAEAVRHERALRRSGRSSQGAGGDG